MLNRAFFKRVVPFLLTFAVGLIIAGFFVSITPTFKFRKHNESCGRRHEMRMMKQENKRLKWENEQLRNNRMDNSQEMYLIPDELVPPPPPMPPVAPAR